eukprot:6205440-Pleurochrysis_carterae.AAC.1
MNTDAHAHANPHAHANVRTRSWKRKYLDAQRAAIVSTRPRSPKARCCAITRGHCLFATTTTPAR